jgi:hypothetical protein
VAKLGPDGSHLWSKRFGDAAGFQSANDVAVDALGNVIVGGTFSGTVNFGGVNLTATASDAFVVKLGPAGTHLWSQRFGGSADQTIAGVAVDTSGNILLTGNFESSITFGMSTYSTVNVIDKDGFVAKLNAAGMPQWSFEFGDAVILNGIEAGQSGVKIATDTAGNVYVVGNFESQMAIPGGATMSSAGNADIFIAKVSSAGVHQWSKRFGDAASQSVADLAVNAAGDILAFAGELNGTVSFGGASLAGQGFGDALFVSLDTAAGNHKFSKSFGAGSPDNGTGITFDPQGNIIASGRFSATVNLGGPVYTATFTDHFLLKMTGNGNHIWSKTFGSGAAAIRSNVGTDGMGGVVFAACGNGALDFGGGIKAGGGNADLFVAKFTP